MDIFQISLNSADAKPGKGTGETLVSPPSTYMSLAAIPHWRRKIASGDTTLLAQTGKAELWEFSPGKGKTRRLDWEELRASSAGLSMEGNLPKQAVEMEAKPSMKEKLAAKQAEIKARKALEKAALEAQTQEAAAAPSVAAAPVKKSATKTKKAAASASIAVEEASVAAAPPESTLAADVGEPVTLRVPDADEEAQQNTVRFCPTCNYYLYLNETTTEEGTGLYRLCRNCGYNEMDTKGGLVTEIHVQEKSTESYKILLNEYTRRDPRLPHIRGVMKCPDETCQSNVGGIESDIIYMKYDGVNLMYLYICDVCGYRWHSRR